MFFSVRVTYQNRARSSQFHVRQRLLEASTLKEIGSLHLQIRHAVISILALLQSRCPKVTILPA